MPNDAVTIGYVHPNELAHSFHQSLLNLFSHDLTSKGRVARGGWIANRCYGADGIPAARNNVVEQFLRDKDSDWLLFIDSDMGFKPDSVDLLLEVADPKERPIVGGLCFSQKAVDSDSFGGWKMQMLPTLFDWVTITNQHGKEESGFTSRRTYPVNTVVRVAGTGSAFILIHRSVFEKMEAKYGKEWYSRVVNPTADNQLMGEDLSFCLRAGALDIPVYIHTGVRTTHFKSMWLSEQDYWFNERAQPATDRVDVLVPVMRRPGSAQPFMDSLRASTGLATCFAICDVQDTETVDAWRAAGAKIITMPHRDKAGTFAEKVNVGYRKSRPTSGRDESPWVFICGDDVSFYPGWLDHVQQVAKSTNRYVIGTNDLSNPRSLGGEHSGHLLIHRSYVDTYGCSFDGPGSIAHEGYKHWYVDDEIVQVAKAREAWGMALGSIVEHLHPIWGKGEPDDVYDLGQGFALEDLELYKKRLSDNGLEENPR